MLVHVHLLYPMHVAMIFYVYNIATYIWLCTSPWRASKVLNYSGPEWEIFRGLNRFGVTAVVQNSILLDQDQTFIPRFLVSEKRSVRTDSSHSTTTVFMTSTKYPVVSKLDVKQPQTNPA